MQTQFIKAAPYLLDFAFGKVEDGDTGILQWLARGGPAQKLALMSTAHSPPNSDGIAFANLLIDRVMKAESGAKHRALGSAFCFPVG